METVSVDQDTKEMIKIDVNHALIQESGVETIVFVVIIRDGMEEIVFVLCQHSGMATDVFFVNTSFMMGTVILPLLFLLFQRNVLLMKS